jgi:hypothetical protein
MNKSILIVLLLSGCSALAGLATSSLMPGSGGGIDAELTVGDKEQTLGANQDVKAEAIGKVVGANDSSTNLKNAEHVEVTNQNIPTEIFGGLILLAVLGWMCPTPTRMWNSIKRKIPWLSK